MILFKLSISNPPFNVSMIKAINPRYQLPHKDCFNRVTIPSLYDEVHIDVEKEMVDNTFYYSATTDLWSSCTTEPYLCYTIHYIDVGLGDITVFSCDTIYFSYRYSRYSDEILSSSRYSLAYEKRES